MKTFGQNREKKSIILTVSSLRPIIETVLQLELQLTLEAEFIVFS